MCSNSRCGMPAGPVRLAGSRNQATISPISRLRPGHASTA
jgi:hypothetical protein